MSEGKILKSDGSSLEADPSDFKWSQISPSGFKPMKGLILAGGKGTRLRPLTINTPKPVVPVANCPFLLYQIDLMQSAGIKEIILSLSYQPRKIEDLLKDGSDYGVWIRYAVEGVPLGTGGAFKNAEEHIDSATVVFNGDVMTSIDLAAVIALHKQKGAVATIV